MCVCMYVCVYVCFFVDVFTLSYVHTSQYIHQTLADYDNRLSVMEAIMPVPTLLLPMPPLEVEGMVGVLLVGVKEPEGVGEGRTEVWGVPRWLREEVGVL